MLASLAVVMRGKGPGHFTEWGLGCCLLPFTAAPCTPHPDPRPLVP